ncbi:MAG: DUF6166 domain-containing protein [Rhodospirillaceae bacterium]|nr:DUF6166 domain-containing protein [Rhodospirillaceae bacterium]
MPIYTGKREGKVTSVTVDGVFLDPRTDIRELSSDGFEWGYVGSGPYQLALAMLANHFDNDSTALGNYRSFCETVVARFASDGWTMESDAIDCALEGVIEVNMTLEELLNKARGTIID